MACRVRDDQSFRLEGGKTYGFKYLGFPLGVEKQDARLGVIYVLCDFTRAEAVAYRTVHSVKFVAGHIYEYEFRAVEELVHYHVSFLHSVPEHGCGELVAFAVQFIVGPSPVCVRIYQGPSVSISPDIAHKAGNPSVFSFENLSEFCVHVVSCILVCKLLRLQNYKGGPNGLNFCD